MIKQEAIKAIKQSKRIHAYVKVTEDNGPRAFRLSKAKALVMLQAVPDDATIRVEWLEGAPGQLLLG